MQEVTKEACAYIGVQWMAEQARQSAWGLAEALWAAPCSMLRLSTAGFQKQCSLEQSRTIAFASKQHVFQQPQAACR